MYVCENIGGLSWTHYWLRDGDYISIQSFCHCCLAYTCVKHLEQFLSVYNYYNHSINKYTFTLPSLSDLLGKNIP